MTNVIGPGPRSRTLSDLIDPFKTTKTSSPLRVDAYSNDTIRVTDAIDTTVLVHGGDDTVFTAGGNDTIYDNDGGQRFVTLFTGQTVLVSGTGFSGDDVVFAGSGNDIIKAGDGRNTYNGEGDIDTIDYSRASVEVTVDLNAGTGRGDGIDALYSIENAIGSAHNDRLVGVKTGSTLEGRDGNDSLRGLEGADTLIGGKNDDILEGGRGRDILDGGEDHDIASYLNAGSSVFVDLGLGAGFGGDAAGDSYISIEEVWGSRFDDGIIGDGLDNVILGGGGKDTLEGGGGRDRFVYIDYNDSSVARPDTIMDFEQGLDIVDLSYLDTIHEQFTDGNQPPATMQLVSAFTGDAGQVRVTNTGTTTSVHVDLDGDRAADFLLTLNGRFQLTEADFWL